MRKIRKIMLRILGVFLFFYAVITGFAANFSDSNYLFMVIGVCAVLAGIFLEQLISFMSHGLGRVLKMCFLICLVLFVVSFMICFVRIRVAAGKAVPQPGRDAVIVLGAGLKGDQVSRTLANRLDAAYKYAVENPETVVVVSGSQGPNELVTEAFAMNRYLVQKGLDPKRIILEDRSTSTRENMLFSKAILDQRFKGRSYRTVIATNDFHIFRALLYAGDAGLSAEGLACPGPLSQSLNAYAREYFALLRYMIVKR